VLDTSMRFRRSTIAVALLIGATWLSLAPEDGEIYPGDAREIWVVDHGWHASIVVRPEDLAAAALSAPGDARSEAVWALAQVELGAEWLEIGWGDEGFFRSNATTAAEVPLPVTLRALFQPSPSVLHVFPGGGDVRATFPASSALRLTLSDEGFHKMAFKLGASVEISDGGLLDRGPGLYGEARFYEARGSYSALATCNHWVSDLLRAAGAPSSWIASAFSAGLMAELRVRI